MSSEPAKPKIGFSFSKVVQPKSKIVQQARFRQAEKPSENEKRSIDFITTIDNNEIISTTPTIIKLDKEECIIPLIRVNKYRTLETKDEPPTSTTTAPADDSSAIDPNDLDAKAKRELLREANKRENDDDVPAWKALIINKAPDTYENDNRLDVSIRPPEPSLDDYETIPIESFGKGMLRGMGWKDGEAIGGKNKGITPIFEPKLRAKGLGLGADAELRKQVAEVNKSSKSNSDVKSNSSKSNSDDKCRSSKSNSDDKYRSSSHSSHSHSYSSKSSKRS